jgi:hypothetical protein
MSKILILQGSPQELYPLMNEAEVLVLAAKL